MIRIASFARLLLTASLLALATRAAHAAPDAEIRSLCDRGLYKQARARLELLARTAPDDAETHLMRSRVALAFGDVDGAVSAAEAATKAAPDHADAHSALADAVGIKAMHASAISQLGLARRVKKEAETAAALDPRHVGARTTLVQYYLLAPGIVGGDRNKAHAMADELARIDPVEGEFARAQCASRDKQPARAESLYRAAVAVAPGSYEARMALARVLATDTRAGFDEAIEQARAAIAIDPERSGGYSVLTAVYAHRGEWSALDLALADAEHANRGDRSPAYVAARTLVVDETAPQRAEALLRRYLEQEPEGAAPSLAHAHWRLGLALEQEGKPLDAIHELEQALALKPDLSEARKDLKRLKKG